ncbi:hypothetical protein HDU76_005430, partial [Blyttiomyces sp. JEL0837]
MSLPAAATGLGDLPPEIIGNIILCSDVSSTSSYLTLCQISKVFNNAMKRIPKVILVNLTITRKDLPTTTKGLGHSIGIDSTACEISWRMESNDSEIDREELESVSKQERQCLSIGSCYGEISSTAVPEQMAFLLRYLKELAMMAMFQKVRVPNVKVVCHSCEVKDMREPQTQAVEETQNDASQDAVFRLMRGLRPK